MVACPCCRVPSSSEIQDAIWLGRPSKHHQLLAREGQMKLIKLKTLLSLLVVMLCTSRPAFAYLQLVHREITKSAFSRLQIDFRSRLGISPDEDLVGQKPRDLMAGGAFEEDNNIRCVNHFYDPAHEAPLTVGALFCFPVPGSFTAR